MFCCDVDSALCESVIAFTCPTYWKRRFNHDVLRGESKREEYLPFFEVLAVGIVLYTVDHEIGQVAVFMCYHIYETI